MYIQNVRITSMIRNVSPLFKASLYHLYPCSLEMFSCAFCSSALGAWRQFEEKLLVLAIDSNLLNKQLIETASQPINRIKSHYHSMVLSW